jgi:hypothetical protein
MNDERDAAQAMANAYCRFLAAFPWSDPLAIKGGRESINKFLSNVYLASFPGCRKHQLTQFITRSALAAVRENRLKELVFEHVVPKQKFIQGPCEAKARAQALTPADVLALMKRYWLLATVTRSEEKRLTRDMPPGWDGVSLFARYEAAELPLLPNPFVVPGVPEVEAGPRAR